ncbi:MAG: hypothetical protein HY323_14445 [Betaproteobacteria bacterium]|nr:hypothetical protein [Betaproteobacteria bacterium]
MALGRYKTFVAGTTALSADMNALQDHFTGNAATLISPFTNNLNANGQQITNLVIETVSATPSAAPEGRMVYHTTLDTLLVMDGAAVRYVPIVSGGFGTSFHTLRMTSAGTGMEFATTNVAVANVTGIGTIATQNLTGISLTGYLEAVEIATPSNPSANAGRLFFHDRGDGKTQLSVLWSDGAVRALATSN